MVKVKNYIEHRGKAIETGGRFSHVMALSLNPLSHYKDGIARCIISREGSVDVAGCIDRSELRMVAGNSLEHFAIGERIKIHNEDEIIAQLGVGGLDFIGLEDPDIFIDEITGLTHLYFTVPFIDKVKNKTLVYLGHAVGKDLNSLEMIDPVLGIDSKTYIGAKEVCIAPINKKGFRYNLVESSVEEEDFTYSTVRVAIAEDMGKPWRFGETVFHPKEHDISWIAGHASPGPLLPKSFIDLGEGKILGIINGREANKKIVEDITYGMFSIGLFIYDYEEGKIDWVSSEPFIKDSEAKTITFASQFVEIKEGNGILYAHVDDSFVRAYTLNSERIRSLLPI